MLPELKQAVGNCVGDEEKQHAKATVQIENTCELPGDWIDHQIGQVAVDKRENVHGERVFVKGQWSGLVAWRRSGTGSTRRHASAWFLFEPGFGAALLGDQVH
ncbi:hypothetical protein FQZ97_837310 [compost metagenome]